MLRIYNCQLKMTEALFFWMAMFLYDIHEVVLCHQFVLRICFGFLFCSPLLLMEMW